MKVSGGSSVLELWKQNHRILPKNWVFPNRWMCHGWVSTQSFINTLILYLFQLLVTWVFLSPSLPPSLPPSILPSFPFFFPLSLPFLYTWSSSKGHGCLKTKHRKTKQNWRKAVPQISKGKALQENKLVLGNEHHAYLLSPFFPSLKEWFVVCLLSFLIIPLSTVKGY